MDALQTQQLPQARAIEEGCEPSPEDTSSLPVVSEAPHRSRLHRATNLLALGQYHEAANLCREELADFPESGDAYALLSMAEEQAGRRALAIELLEELLQLDPTRTVEAEHLAELRRAQEEVEAEAPTEEEKEEQIRRLQPVALLMLVAAAVCLLVSLIALGVVRHNRATQAAAAYGLAMRTGDNDMQLGWYPQAVDAYAHALQLFPKDPAARADYAKAVQATQAAGLPVPAPPPPFTINPNGNPLAPGQIAPGATNGPPGAGEFPSATGPAGPPATRSNQRSDTGNSGPNVDWGRDLTPPPGSVINPPLVPTPPPPPAGNPGSGTPGNGSSQPTGGSVAPAVTPPPPPESVINIERTDHPASDSLQKGENLRSQGQGHYDQKDYTAAAKSFHAAVSAYEAAQAQHPEQHKAIDSAIASLQAQIRVCEKHTQ